MTGGTDVLPWGAALATVGATALLAGAWRRAALRRGWLDIPVQRSSHRVPTPRGGGIAIAVLLLAWSACLPVPWRARLAIAGALAAITVVGLVDDLRGLRPATKLAGQAVAVLPVALLGGGALPADSGALAATAAIAGLLLFLVNAWNFMDGINGIAALSASVAGLVALGAGAGAAAVFGLGLAAACLGFLPWNVPRARLFMGDAGSHALGLGVGVLLVLGLFEASPRIPLPVAAACLPFAVDVAGTLARRALDGEPLASAHRRHLYQLAVRCGYSHGRVALAYALVAAILGAGVAMVERNFEGAGVGALAASAAIVAVAWAAARASLAPRVLDGDRA